MFKPFTAYLCLFLASWIVTGCGNKGDLFLPTDPGLARELEEASQRTNDIAEDPTEEALEKKKRQAIEPQQ